MSETLTLLPHEYPDTSQMILEDDEPLDSFVNEKQQRLLTTVFYSGADTGIKVPFLAAANVGLFSHVRHQGIVPDAFLSLNIRAGEEWFDRNVRSYLFWEFGKAPDVVIEIVSPTPGNELGSKLIDYAQLGIPYYVVYDPLKKLGEIPLRVFQIQGSNYVSKSDAWFPSVNLGLTLFSGSFENVNATWLRWCYPDGNVIPTGDELAAAKNAEISQKDAELTEKDARLKQMSLLAIEMGLKLKFSNDSATIFSEISAINDLDLLSAIASEIPNITSVEELRKMYCMSKKGN
ncbi:MAG: Uma2 family endonuclease [Cyanobacteriota bacterium]|nr:Uma2 family endonuclease [Cyanobacteriota bacterium]